MDSRRENDIIKAKKLLIEANKNYENIMKMLNKLKPIELNAVYEESVNQFHVNQRTAALVNQDEDNSSEDSTCSSTDSDDSSSSIDTSDDIEFITNTHQKAFVPSKKQPSNLFIPIGSGGTLIHVDKYRTVNWKSYSSATRTLLLAVFSRKILATHCLTGKCSPAFRNKAAKKCLNRKKVSDIIIEVTNKFDIKESLVRNIITTKCADEFKMLKTRQTRQKH